MPVLELTVRVDAPAQQVWDALVDWDRQGEWMLATRVRTTSPSGEGVGATLAARTGAGPLAVLDTMVVTRWEPPLRCEVRHTGRVVRGSGVFVLSPVGDGATDFTWIEELDLPPGAAACWPLVRPLMAWGVGLSLRRFARWVSAPRTPGGSSR